MLILVAFAFVAGVLTILAPCILPVIPLVLGATATGGRRRTLGVFVGFGGTFVATTVVLASLLAEANVTTGGLRIASAILLGLVGLGLVVERIGAAVGRGLTPVARLGTRLVGRRTSDGLIGGVVLGAGIGLVWAPCVGPIMAGVIAAAVTRGPSVEAVVVAGAYVAGAILPLSLIARRGIGARDAMGRATRRSGLRSGFGGAMVLSAVLIVSGLDRTAETDIASFLPPGWSGALAAVEQRPDIQQEIDVLRTGSSATPADAGGQAPGARKAAELPSAVAEALPVDVALEDLGPAPELTGIDAWINTPPLTMDSLRGKVVIVEFWTFGCINCQHVQPYLNAWYDRYAASGLVVVGVHTPELSFERDPGNVRDAVSKADIRFPVAVDPAFATWNAYQNVYWPAFYFIDRAGRIRHIHAGEGAYDESEQVIRELLTAGG